MPGTFPKPYIDSVPEAGKDGAIEHVPFDRLDIGARNSGVPGSVSTGPKSIEHVGGSVGKPGRKG